MEMMHGREELLESIKNNRDLLEEERKILLNRENLIIDEIEKENNKLDMLSNNKKEYENLKKIEIKAALINFLEITGIGVGIFIISNSLDNNVQTITEALKSIQTIFSLVFVSFGNGVILFDTINTLNSFKKENINIFDTEEIDNRKNKLSNDLQNTKSNVSEINNRLNKFNTRIEEFSIDKKLENKNIYENIEEKPVQKIKM